MSGGLAIDGPWGPVSGRRPRILCYLPAWPIPENTTARKHHREPEPGPVPHQAAEVTVTALHGWAADAAVHPASSLLICQAVEQ